MGATFVFKCAACKYEAIVSGGKDSGFIINTQTKTCPACRQLVDVVTGIIRGVNIPEKLKIKMIKAKGHCPECGGVKPLPWKEKSCPKCDGKMKREINEPVCLWD